MGKLWQVSENRKYLKAEEEQVGLNSRDGVDESGVRGFMACVRLGDKGPANAHPAPKKNKPSEVIRSDQITDD